MTPEGLTKGDLEDFSHQEHQTHARPFEKKLGMAIKIWNGAINEGALNATPFTRKRIETTRAYYAEVSKLIAQKRYLQLLDKATLRALGKIDFRVGLKTQLGR